MKPTKKQLKEIQEIEKKVSEVCDTKKTIEVYRDENGHIRNLENGELHFPEQTPDEPMDNHCDFCGEPCEDRYCSKVCKKECERIED